MRWLCAVALMLPGLTGGLLCQEESERITMPASRPRLAYTKDELAAWKNDPARQEEARKVIARADALLAKGLVIPEKEGQWSFYYACPKDGAHLKAESEERHLCPRCQAAYTDERTVAAYRGLQNAELDENLVGLGLAYALTEDPRFAQPVRDALLKLARLCPTLTRHDRWGRTGLLAVVGGRRYCQLLDEATSLIKLAKAYDLAAGATCFSPGDREVVEQQLLRASAREIRSYQFFVGARNNHQTWFNAAYAAAGLASGDEDLLRESVHGSAGLLWQLRKSVTDDGLWYEGALAYQRYAMSAMVEQLNVLRRIGWDFSRNERLRSLWLGPLQLAYPNGQLPVFHDSDPDNLSGWKETYRWGNDYFHDARLAPYAGLPSATPAPLGSANLKGLGIAVLRRGAGADALCAMLDYGLHGDHHGHPDKLNVVLYALGQELLLDPGRISYSVPEYESWCRTTVAHNTVVINQRNQRPDTGRCVFFAGTKDYAACLAASDGAYPGSALKRFLVLADRLLVDVFTISGNQEAALDWLAHGRGTLDCSVPLAPRDAPLGAANGYQHLTGLREGRGAAAVHFSATVADGKAWHVWCVNDTASTIVTGSGIGYRLDDHVAFLLRRRLAASATYVTVFDLSGDGSAVTSIEPAAVTAGGKLLAATDAVGLSIVGNGRSTLVAVDLREDPQEPPTVNGAVFERVLVRR